METQERIIQIPMDPVESSFIAGIGHDPDKLILAVQLKSGPIYHYAGVEVFVFNEFRDALSIGQYFGLNIKGKYQGQKVTGSCSKCGAKGYLYEHCMVCGCDYEPDSPSSKRRVNRPSESRA